MCKYSIIQSCEKQILVYFKYPIACRRKINRILSFIWLDYWSEYFHSFKFFNSFIDHLGKLWWKLLEVLKRWLQPVLWKLYTVRSILVGPCFPLFYFQMKVCACACCSSVMSVWVIMRECLKFRVYWRLPGAWQARDLLIPCHELQKYNESGYDIQFKCVN